MRVGITGGVGFIGHHLAGAIRKTGREVFCLDNLMVNNLYATLPENGWTEHYRKFLAERLAYLDGMGVPLLRMSARDYDVYSQAMDAMQPDLIFHLAAVAHIDRARKDPEGTFNNSLVTLKNTLNIAKRLNCPVVYFSSSTAYGDFSQPVVDETEALTPKGLYGGLKQAGEILCRAYSQDFGVPIVIIRPQALYGPRCISRRVAQIFIEQAIDGKDLTIHGTGSETHDFTYIDDLLQAMMLIVSRLDFKPGLIRTWNVTGENATSLRYLAELVASRYHVGVKYGPKDTDKPLRGTMSCKAIRDELGFVPEYSIERGLGEYMSWYDRFFLETKAA